MIDDGANFTILTMRTPESLQKVLEGIRLKLPIIAMDGTVLYDMNINQFIRTMIISLKTSAKLLNLMGEHELYSFAKAIVDDCLLIFHKDPANEGEEKFMRLYQILKQTVTFGSLEGKYDVTIQQGNTNQVARTLKKMYEVPLWKKI